MTSFILSRLDHNAPDFKSLNDMLHNLEAFLDQPFDINDKSWCEQFEVILNHQAGDGTFRILDSVNEIPSDACYDFCHYPTVLCFAIIMKAVLLYPNQYEKRCLHLLMRAQEPLDLSGHGYEALDAEIRNSEILVNAGVQFILDKYRGRFEILRWKMSFITEFLNTSITDCRFVFGFGQDYEKEIRTTLNNLNHKRIFVYGTLLIGQRNHHYLASAHCDGFAIAYGYDMYNLGAFPGVVESEDIGRIVVGSVFKTNNRIRRDLDRLEGEGYLYNHKLAQVRLNGKMVIAGIYVYAHDVSALSPIPSGDWVGFPRNN